MKLKFQKKWLAGLLAIATAVLLQAQIVSSGLSGLVKDRSGKPVTGATVTITHTLTGTTYTGVTNESGQYNVSGMMAGGPYTVTVSANGYKAGERTGITTELGQTVDANVIMDGSNEIVTMEKVVVGAANNELDSGAAGTGSVLVRSNIDMMPTVTRSIADMARTNPFVELRATLASRAQPIISAVGQNNRFNSIQIDGARINDQFGLNGSGLQSFGNPISLDTIEQMQVAVSPYDSNNSGFTGASINAVTKSGTNRYSGQAYYYYTDQDYQGADVSGSAIGSRAPLKQTTKGLIFSGPILRNKLFFFANYEKYDSLTSDIATVDPTATAQGASDLQRILARAQALNATTGKSYNFGNFTGRTTQLQQKDEKKLIKLDWNLLPGHRLSVRYTKVEGELPIAGKFSQTTTLNPLSTAGGFNVATANLIGLDSNGYNQVRNEETWASQLFSRWGQNLKTELQYSRNKYDQQTPVNSTLPEIRIFGVSGLNRTGATVNGNGVLVLGTEQNRQGNIAAVDTKSYRLNGEYTFQKFIVTGGYDREESDFLNLFRSSSYGQFDFASVTDFENDNVRNFLRSIYLEGTAKDEKSNFAVNGLYSHVKWSVNPLLNITAGLRYDWFEAGKRPPLNAASNPLASTDFQGVFGIRNDGSIDGSNAVSPRFAFNWALSEDRAQQLRGGFGRFVGRIPWVIVSNSYGNSGVGRSTINTGVTSLVTYLRGNEDPNNPQLTFNINDPIGRSKTANVGRPGINLIRDKLLPPIIWRGNLAFDQKLPFSNMVTFEVIHTRADKALFIRDLNLKPRFVGSDGRQVFSGSPGTQANALYGAFGSVHEMSNISMGYSTYGSVSVSRPMKDMWSYNVTYTRGKARDALPLGETVASSQFSRNPIFNQNTPTMARSAFEVRDRLQATIGKDFLWWKKAKTSLSLYYEGRTGNPYSLVYTGDANGDGSSANDLVYIPKGMSDPVIVASIANGMPAAVAQQWVNWVQGRGDVNKYAGSVLPRYGLTMPWTNRLDLHIGQEIPIYGPAQLEVFMDVVNFGAWLSPHFFGYMETINGTGDNELYAFSQFSTATYQANGQLVMTGNTFTKPGEPLPDNNQSRWRLQFGARLKF